MKVKTKGCIEAGNRREEETEKSNLVTGGIEREDEAE